MRITFLVAALICSCSSFAAVTDTTAPGSAFPDKDQLKKMEAVYPLIDSIYRDYAKKNHIPGLAFGIVAGGKLQYAGGYGYMDIAHQSPVTPASVFRIASMTKSFTAMAILRLRDAGKLQLDDPVYKYIPEMKQVRPLTQDAPPITIRHLLTHSAGFPEDNPWGDRQLQRTDQDLLDFLKGGVSLSNAPGLNYEYSNLGFALLGHIVSTVSGESFEQYINENILKPLGMTHTYWEYTDVPAAQLAHGYRWINENWREEALLHSGAYGAMGGMLTSIEDFCRYMAFHLDAWPARDGEDAGPVQRSSVREMHQAGKISGFNTEYRTSAGVLCPRVSAYNDGLGWTKDCMGKEWIGHSGGLPGFGSHWTILPQYGIGIVSFCNLTYAATGGLNIRLIDTLIALAGLTPRPVNPSAILRQRRDELVRLLPDWKEAEASGIFAENFFDDYPIDSLRKEAKMLFDKAGRILGVQDMIPDNQLRGDFVIRGEKTNLRIRFTLSPENPGRIQEYHIREVSRYGLQPVSGMENYRRLIQQDPRQELVALDKFIPGIRLDIRYATANNLMHYPVYGMAAAYLRRPAAEALRDIQKELNAKGYGLKIFDGYRPYRTTVIFYEKYHDTAFVASPYTGSRHNRGCAVDMTIIDLKTGKELEMPTAYDAFTKKAAYNYPDLPVNALKNRQMMQDVMLRHGFVIYPDEWWHFDFGGWRQYPVMDIPFEELRMQSSN